MTTNLGASIRARLLNKAKADGVDFNQILVRFALERFLYRISQSAHSEFYVLKGALLFTLWYDMPHRSTRDADLLGFGESNLNTVRETFREIASLEVEDGIVFEPTSVTVEEIRKEAGYAGVRVLISATLDGARCKTQIDIGYGDAVTPSPIQASYPTLIEDLPAPKLRTYPIYTVVAEKFHAIALFGMANTRLKDYFDLYVIFSRENLNAMTLVQAINATFMRRGMDIPKSMPVGLTDDFAMDTSRQAIWNTFVRKNDLVATPLPEVAAKLRTEFGKIMASQ
jgi:predicted nucleotidyltransferase component of viral defense system